MAQKFEEFLHCQLDTKGSSNLNQPYFEIPCLGVLAAGPFEWQFISYSPSAPPFYSTTSPPPLPPLHFTVRLVESAGTYSHSQTLWEQSVLRKSTKQ